MATSFLLGKNAAGDDISRVRPFNAHEQRRVSELFQLAAKPEQTQSPEPPTLTRWRNRFFKCVTLSMSSFLDMLARPA